jgi:hypothetical protein
MGDQIFTVGPSGFQALDPEAYQGEAELQKLLAVHPELLAVERRRWLLIRREVPVPADQGGSNKWSLDHLFLDDEAVPTFIETKLATNPGIRREVVGQMLDYAANGSVYWPIKQIRGWFEDTVNAGGGNADSALAAFLGDGLEPHAFWEQARVNLEAGRLRLLFVADRIPAELQRIVEFLNEQMANTEVLAVEIRRYASKGGQATIVPRVLGLTSKAQSKKAEAVGRRWDEGTLFEDLSGRVSAGQVEVARTIYRWGKEHSDIEWWGQGTRSGSYMPGFVRNGIQYWPLALWTYGRVEVAFQTLSGRAAFADEKTRRLLLEQLNSIPGVAIPDVAITKRPSIALELLLPAESMRIFLAAADWMVERIRTIG